MVTDKELEAVGLKKNLQNIDNEIVIITAEKEKQENLKALFTRQLELANMMHTRALEQFELLKPTWKFETDPEYNDWKKEYTDIQHKFNMMQQEGTTVQFDAKIASMTEQLTSQTNAKKQVEEQLTALGN